MSHPSSTYRIQLQPAFGFDDAAAIVPYLAALGVSHLYSSPSLQAAKGSTHGYDVVDHARLSVDLGGDDGHATLCARLQEQGMGQVLDIVPNHMAVAPENRWWYDLLENGPASRYAPYFDVDWNPPEQKLRNIVLLPVLHDHYGRVLEAGELVLRRRAGELVIQYGDLSYPVAPPSYDAVLEPAAERCGDDDLAFLSGSFAALPPAWITDEALAGRRHRDKEVLKRHLAELLARRAACADEVDAVIGAINSDADRLDGLLGRQNYRLAHWRTASEDVDYRRFFDISGLVGLRMEDPRVFGDTHALVLRWLDEAVLDGVRIDHPDGLRDPAGYLDRLRAVAPDAWIVAEKILEPDEAVPATWPVDGTTGYEFLNRLGGLFVDPAGEQALTVAYTAFTGAASDYGSVVHDAKELVIADTLASDFRRLTNLFVEVTERERRYRDFTRKELSEAIAAVAVTFGVYRTYVRPGREVVDVDAEVIHRAVAAARARRPDLDPELFELLERILRGEIDGAGAELCERFQQLTAAVMAKGVEDTAFYRYNRLTCLNEVGGEPSRFGRSVDEFHRDMIVAAERWPGAMLSSSTHDTKRSEDVRARIALLSEIPGDFARAVDRWSAMHEPPDRNLAWLLFQALVGAHPLEPDRAIAYA